eukprot:XP_001704870.1 Hypothetical protein GL50803_39690 [Giardia lamblia ATCC 50803]
MIVLALCHKDLQGRIRVHPPMNLYYRPLGRSQSLLV